MIGHSVLTIIQKRVEVRHTVRLKSNHQLALFPHAAHSSAAVRRASSHTDRVAWGYFPHFPVLERFQNYIKPPSPPSAIQQLLMMHIPSSGWQKTLGSDRHGASPSQGLLYICSISRTAWRHDGRREPSQDEGKLCKASPTACCGVSLGVPARPACLPACTRSLDLPHHAITDRQEASLKRSAFFLGGGDLSRIPARAPAIPAPDTANR